VNTGGRARARGRILQRAGLLALALVLLTIVLLFSGHWVLAIIAAVLASVAGWVYLQARAVR
jgi:hypothetical protein